MKVTIDNGTLLVRFVYENKIHTGRVVSEDVELLDGRLQPTGQFYPLRQITLLPPVEPTKIWCVGLNYLEHAKEAKMSVPEEPCIFMKPLTTLVPHEAVVKFPTWAGRVDYEGELAVVIKETCKNLDESDALDYVLGYSCFNDVTARELQYKDGQWIRAKGFDTFGPFGPYILVARSMPDSATLTTRLNGQVVQRGNFGDMIFSVPQIIAHISRFATLEAGDIIATGTPCGIGPVKHGDEVEIEIEGIGTLKNKFMQE